MSELRAKVRLVVRLIIDATLYADRDEQCDPDGLDVEGFVDDLCALLLDEREPVGRLYYEATTGGRYSTLPHYAHGMDSILPACHKIIPLYRGVTDE